jgi:hypothetical protein
MPPTGTPRAISSSVMPNSSKISSVRACTPTARDCVVGARFLSTSRTRTPRRASSPPRASPVGPAPTASTSTSPLAMRV